MSNTKKQSSDLVCKLLLGASVMTVSAFVSISNASAQLTVPCPGTESRVVTCRDFRGNIVADSYCVGTRAGGKPRATQGCTASCPIRSGDGDGDGGDGDGDGDGDPLVFDLDGDGISLLSVDDGVMFDMDNDGHRDKTGWVDGTDGILVFDDNGNGRIDNQSEMFGNEKDMAFKHLSEYDSNDDGLMTRDDHLWKHLRMWVDEDVDGRTDPGELKKMWQVGIVEIDLGYNSVDLINAGNKVTGLSSFSKKVGGEIKEIVNGVMEALFDFVNMGGRGDDDDGRK